MTRLTTVDQLDRSSIDTDLLRDLLDDPGTAIVDVRPLAAFNGWRLDGEERGGHIPGAVAFPASWLDAIEEEEVAHLLGEKGLLEARSVVVYGSLEADALEPGGAAGSARTARRPHLQRRVGPLVGRRVTADRAPHEPHRARPHPLAARAHRRRAPGGRAGRRLAAAARELRCPGGVSRLPSSGRALSRHEPTRGPGRLEPPRPRRARGHADRAGRDRGHDGRPLRPRHGGPRRGEVAGPSGGPDRGDAGGAHPHVRGRTRCARARRWL